MRLPSVIALKQYVPLSRRPAFTRFNVFLRDRFACQYCGDTPGTSELTFDHVIPKSRGGLTSWDNVVAACSHCNLMTNAVWSRRGRRPSRRTTGCSATAAPSRPTTFTKAGATSCTGIPSSNRAEFFGMTVRARWATLSRYGRIPGIRSL